MHTWPRGLTRGANDTPPRAPGSLERGVGDTDVSELFKSLGLKEDGMISLDAWRAGFGKFVALTETEAEAETATST